MPVSYTHLSDGPQQGALARAVAADQGGEGLRGEVGGDVLQQAAVAVGERDMSLSLIHISGTLFGCGNREFDRSLDLLVQTGRSLELADGLDGIDADLLAVYGLSLIHI